MYLNIMAHEPDPRDIVAITYRNSLIDAFFFKASSGTFGYGLGEDAKAFWADQIKVIAPSVAQPNAGIQDLLAEKRYYEQTGMQQLATSGLTAEMQILFNTHLVPGAKIGNQSVLPNPDADSVVDHRNLLNIPVKTLIPGTEGKYLYSWTGTIDGKGVRITYDENSQVYVRETFDGPRLTERIVGTNVDPNGGVGAYGQFDLNMTTTKFASDGSVQSTSTRVESGGPDYALRETDHFNAVSAPGDQQPGSIQPADPTNPNSLDGNGRSSRRSRRSRQAPPRRRRPWPSCCRRRSPPKRRPVSWRSSSRPPASPAHCPTTSSRRRASWGSLPMPMASTPGT